MRDRLIGKTLGDFEIESLLGSGAMGKVYRAMQISLRRPVALKVLEEGLFTPDEFKVRFRREAEYIARLEHPHIISVYQYGHQEPYTFYAMRLVEGLALDHFLAEGLAMRTGLRWLADIAGALSYAHEHQVIHRDVKPANIMIANDAAYLADFGLARLMESTTITASGVLLGTLLYMAPEQVRRERADEASDVYAMGVILYELTTARHPFGGGPTNTRPGTGQARVETMDRIGRGVYPKPSEMLAGVPPLLEQTILRAMALAPGDRHGSARELQKEIQHGFGSADLAGLDRERAEVLGRPITPPSSGARGDVPFAGGTGPVSAGALVSRAIPVVESPSAPDPVTEPPRFGRYRLLEELGRTAWSVRHKAVEQDRNRMVALERYDISLGSDPDRAVRFRLYAASVAALRHANVLTVHEAGDAEGKPYFATELVEAQDLDALAARGPLSPRRAAEIVRDAARGVAYAQAQGIQHLDLRSSSILVDAAGRVYVRGFGTADFLRDRARPATEPGAVRESPAYLAPEAVQGGGDAQSDVYGLGAIFYRLISGRAPFEGESDPAIARCVLQRAPVPIRSLRPGVHPDAEGICRRAMAKAPAARHPGAEALARALDAFAQGEAGEEPGGWAWGWARGFFPRTVVLIAALALVAAVTWGRLRDEEGSRLLAEERARAVESMLRADDLDRAEERSREAVESIPYSGEAWYWRGRTLLRRALAGERVPRVFRAGEKLVFREGVRGGDEEMRHAFGQAMTFGGLDERAVGAARGVLAMLDGDTSQPCLDLASAAEAGDGGWEITGLLGLACYFRGDYPAAAKTARAGLARWKAADGLAELLVRAELALGLAAESPGGDPLPFYRAALAVADRQRSLEMPEQVWAPLRGEIWVRIGAHHAARGDESGKAEAAEAFVHALEEVKGAASEDADLVRGEALLERAVWGRSSGRDVAEDLEGAIAAMERAAAGRAGSVARILAGREGVDPRLKRLAERCGGTPTGEKKD